MSSLQVEEVKEGWVEESSLVSTTLVLGYWRGQFPCIHACQDPGLCVERQEEHKGTGAE